MDRQITVGSAQLGPIARSDTRARAVARLLELLRQAKSRGCRLVVFPELALTTFFLRWYMEDPEGVDAFFETEMPGPETKALFEKAAELEVGFYLGYAERSRPTRADARQENPRCPTMRSAWRRSGRAIPSWMDRSCTLCAT